MSRRWIGSALLIVIVLGSGGLLGARKYAALRASAAAAASQPEPMESVSVAFATPREHRPFLTSIGTVLATRSVTLRNELAGTVREVALESGRTVEAGAVLVALDVSVEEAELAAQRAQAQLAQTLLDRNQQASENHAVSQVELDRARAERDVALARIAQTEAVIERKVIRAPFRARVGLSDVHPGQYLDEGTVLTTLQGIDSAVHVDFAVPQRVAEGLRRGDRVQVFVAGRPASTEGTIVAIDSRIDPTTRNAMVRARVVEEGDAGPAPGSSVRVQVPDGPPDSALAVPVNALRKGPAGDYVFVVETAQDGTTRAHVRPVHSGAVLGDEVLIAEGLAPGERVATSGSFKLRESVLVAVADQPAVVAARGSR